MSLLVNPVDGPKVNLSFKTKSRVSFRESESVDEVPLREENVKVVDNPSKKGISKKNLLPIVTSAVALTSLGVAIYSLNKGRSNSSQGALDALTQKFNDLFHKVETQGSSSVAPETITNLQKEISALKNSGIKAELESRLESLKNKINNIHSDFNGITFFNEKVVANNHEFTVANVLNPVYGNFEVEMTKALQTESVKRMIGLGKTLESLPENAVIRIPTSEYKGYASTGGMSIVPKEIAQNLMKLLAGRQKAQVYVDLPLYRGMVEKSEVKGDITQRFNGIRRAKDNTWEYIQTVITDKANAKVPGGREIKTEVNVLANMKKINTMDLKIHTDKAVVNERVDVFLAEQKVPLGFDEHLEKISGELKNKIFAHVEEYSTPLNEVEKNALRTLIEGESLAPEVSLEFKKVLEENANPSGLESHVNEILQSIETRAKEAVSKNDGVVPADVKVLSKETKKIIEKLLTESEKEITSNLFVTKSKLGKPTLNTKVQTVFYDNGSGGKFDLNTRITPEHSDIYSKEAIAAGETERFAYFAKFFYEQLVRGDEAAVPMKADLIIGNDWHTGFISAMMRQLSTAKKYYGMNSALADKLHDTPIVTILHNATLTGGDWASQDKLLNVLFGDLTSTILKNSHMPNVHVEGKYNGFNPRNFNALLEGDGVAPQMMAAAYSDVIIPVSKPYGVEISTNSAYGGARTDVFAFRSQIGDVVNKDILKDIMLEAKLDPKLLPNELRPTLVGITNGCDRANNLLTAKKAKDVAEKLGLPEGSFKALSPGEDVLAWHNHNKKAALEKMRLDIDKARLGEANDMCIEAAQSTDLTGVTEKTPVFVSAGRIVDQKGLDILGKSIVEFYKDFKGTDYPVFYIQGVGKAQFKQHILDAKAEVAKFNPDAAKRIVFANLFSEPGRFDCAKIVTDWALMSSKFEPCGLSHKEMGLFSGCGTVATKTGGLAEGYKEGVNILSSTYNPVDSVENNAKHFADKLKEAVAIHSDEAKFREVIDTTMRSNFDWAREGGPIYEYLDIFQRMGVISKDIK